MVQCPNCQHEMPDGSVFCEQCGATISTQNNPYANSYETNSFDANNYGDTTADTAVVAKKKSSLPMKKILMFGGIAVAAIVVIVLLCMLIFGGESKENYALYIKDGEMFYNDLEGGKSWEITEKLSDELSGSTLKRVEEGFACITEDGSKIFYADRLDNAEGGLSLYYRNLESQKSEPVKISSDIKEYYINDSASIITYKKDDNLYQYTLKKKDSEKIASDVSSYLISEDGKTIYFTSEENLYVKKSGKDKEKITGNVIDIEYVSEDYKTLYFTKSDEVLKESEYGNYETYKLYKYTGKKEAELIVSGVYRTYIYESGEMYFTKAELKTIEESEQIVQTLYWFDGKKETKLDEDFLSIGIRSYPDAKTPYALYACGTYEDYEVKIAIKGKAQKFKSEKPSFIGTSEDYSVGYFMDNITENENGELKDHEILGDIYKFEIKDGKLVEPKKLYEDVVCEACDVTLDGKVIYFKDVDEKGVGTLFVDKKQVAEDVSVDEVEEYEGKIYYMTDYSEENNYGTLNVYDGKKATKIDDDVSGNGMKFIENGVLFITDYDEGEGTLNIFTGKKAKKVADDVYASGITVVPSGSILYLTDYSLERYYGQLNLYADGKSKKLDEDVNRIVDIYEINSGYRYYSKTEY